MRKFNFLFLSSLFLFSCSYGDADNQVNKQESIAPPNITDGPLCSDGIRLIGKEGDVAIKMLLEESNLGTNEVEIAELTMAYRPEEEKIPPHVHGSLEIFYVISGEMEFSVNNGPVKIVKPGSVAVVKKGDLVNHNVASQEPLKALIIWVPGGEADRVIERTKFPVTALN